MLANTRPDRSSLYWLVALLLVLPLTTGAQENTIDLESTFKGNQEQPKVLYIVPWRKIEGPDAVYQPLESLIEENLSLIDRDEFRREVNYKRASSLPSDGQIPES